MLTYCLDLSAVRAKKKTPQSSGGPATWVLVSIPTTRTLVLGEMADSRLGPGRYKMGQKHLAVLKVRKSSENDGDTGTSL